AVDSELGDRTPARHAELLLGLGLRGQAVAVPSEAPLHPLAAHGAVTGDDVFDVSGQKVTVVWQTVGERWTVIEDELVFDRPALNRPAEGVCGGPGRQDLLLDLRESRRAWDVRVA